MTQPSDPNVIKQREHTVWSNAAPGWRTHDTKLTALGAPVTEEMIRRAGIERGHRALDLACGTGEPALRIAERVGPAGAVLATDFAEPMLAFGREKAAARGLGNVEFRCADAEAVELAAGSFDAATSRWGVMFMPRPQDALARAHAALRRGGRIALAAWGPPEKNPFIAMPLGVLRKHVEVPAPPPHAPGIFAFADGERLRATLDAAGFRSVAVEAFAFPISGFDDGRDLWGFTRDIAGPIAQLYASLPPAARRAVDDEVAAAAERFRRGAQLVLPAETWIAVGTKD